MYCDQRKPSNVMLVSMFIGFSIGAVLWANAAPPSQKIPDVVQAHRFELVDQDAKVRVRLSTDASDATSFIIYDKSGNERISLIAEGAREDHGHITDATTSLSLFNPKKNMDIHLLASDNGDGQLTFGSQHPTPTNKAHERTFADLKVSSTREGVSLRLSALGDGYVGRPPAKGEASVELTSPNHTLYWNAAK